MLFEIKTTSGTHFFLVFSFFFLCFQFCLFCLLSSPHDFLCSLLSLLSPPLQLLLFKSLLPELLLISHLLLPLLLLHLPESLPVPLLPEPLQPVLLYLLQSLQSPLLVALYHTHGHRALRQFIVAYEHVHLVFTFKVGDEVDLKFGVIIGVDIHESNFEFASIVKGTPGLQKPRLVSQQMRGVIGLSHRCFDHILIVKPGEFSGQPSLTLIHDY